ncbi:hypothetical protein N7448_003911 [Penicillium atrosanguineum]|uniref:P-loop containing nucleoside triphosphate hydrolase protein n=1 Tax=Penicillium atrosanguineum TaxID=1132637 RepID=A0A9W9L6F7_9EURO|nr:uncharacterized protein N7443_002877 [Penicillium atrosanguineum]KAJ5122778.1 hypothetical protein N7526_009715 [Penicillium atrosanguineum]KAJ5140503.1 hypothetical protein N7448_003911 [Penicillium atrosanguineum]KAJ5310416.1 hypothetical protein N7443_002877 [Penicillium atrosanguineum]KAJ5315936.1 hypothetical protein N7476_006243 [Penicillium atrosanguineum]
MSRGIDQMPVLGEVKKMKVIVASPSRSGTLGLYKAMQILGYKPYHMYECCAIGGVPHMRTFKEGIIAETNRLSGGKRYSKADFDNWLGEYDCLIEIPAYAGMDMIRAYVQDPNVKFILTERSPERWAISVNNTAAEVVALADRFPVSILKYFDSFLYQFFALNQVIYRAIAGGTMPGDPDNERMLQRWYIEYMKEVKDIIPADRMCLIQLKDGLDWEKICPFLGVPIPKDEYPDRNEPEKFQAMVQSFVQPKLTAAMIRFSLVAVPTFGTAVWATWKYGPSIVSGIRFGSWF